MPKQSSTFICPACGADAPVVDSERLLGDITIRRRRCSGIESHTFETKVMEEALFHRDRFLHEVAFTAVSSPS